MGYATANTLWPCGHYHQDLVGLGSGRMGAGQPPPPGVCCQLDPAGNTVCSDGNIFPPSCPKRPATNVQGTAEYRNDNGILRPIPPTAQSCAAQAAPAPAPAPVAAPSTSSKILPWVGIFGVGYIAYTLLK